MSTPSDLDGAANTTNTSVARADDKVRYRDPDLTVRAIAVGLAIGVLINLSNIYYGLRIGAGNSMTMVSALLGFAIFKALSPYLSTALSKGEHVLLLSTATSVGSMPITTGFVGVIPALEYLLRTDEDGPLPVKAGSLVLWSFGLCFFGTLFAALLRKQFVEREKLPWPGATATSHLLSVLHRDSNARDQTAYARRSNLSNQSVAADASTVPGAGQDPYKIMNKSEWKASVRRLMSGNLFSAVMSILMYFLPSLHNFPIFGLRAAQAWKWTLDASPGFFGQGIIMGPAVTCHMLLGAIVGWGILSPYAKARGWAPGEVDDWTEGSRGWIIWISLASLFADASIKFAGYLCAPLWKRSRLGLLSEIHIIVPRRYRPRLRGIRPNTDGYDRLATEERNESQSRNSRSTSESNGQTDARASADDYISQMTYLGFFIASIVICLTMTHVVFGNVIAPYLTLLAVVLSLPMAVIGIRCIAETDYNPESALISQLIFASLVNSSQPYAIIINLLSAAIAQAGSNQSGDLAYDLKVGYDMGARPETQLYGQTIGSIVGAFISCGIYKIYSASYSIPGPIFQVPSSYLVLSTARLLLGNGLPAGVTPFVISTAVLSSLATLIKIRYSSRWWQALIPSGVSFAIGIYLTPSFTLIYAMGGIFSYFYLRRNQSRKGGLIIIASGLVLGEALSSIADILLTALQVPHL